MLYYLYDNIMDGHFECWNTQFERLYDDYQFQSTLSIIVIRIQNSRYHEYTKFIFINAFNI